jgi:rare lipoprotein A (peptidoglycan hydrolase)|tara:strand:- start:655 stop:1185 length:531 start_codon:yes stop_codon:yes gene_type:complete
MSIKLLKIALIFFFISYNNSYSQDKEYHIVEKGETFYSISKKFNMSIEELKKINNSEGNTLSVGQKIRVRMNKLEEKKIKSNNKVKTNRVEGFASSIFDSKNYDKYLALHKTAEVGTIIFVKNQMNDDIVIVRVIGKLPKTGNNDKIDIRLSSVAFEKLNAKDQVIPVELTYVEKK